MRWNWQQTDWPHFTYDKIQLKDFETRFLHQSGIFLGAFTHFDDAEKKMN